MRIGRWMEFPVLSVVEAQETPSNGQNVTHPHLGGKRVKRNLPRGKTNPSFSYIIIFYIFNPLESSFMPAHRSEPIEDIFYCSDLRSL